MNHLTVTTGPHRGWLSRSLACLLVAGSALLVSLLPLTVYADTPPSYLTQWGSSGNGNGQFNYPYSVATDSSGNVYVADQGNNRIQKFSSSGSYLSQWGSSGSGNGQFNYPYGVATDSSGNVYVADKDNNRIQKFTSSGSYVTQWGSQGSGNGQLNYPRGVATDSSGNVYVTDGNNHRIQKFTSSGGYLTQWGSSGNGNGQFNYPHGVATDSSGNVYVVDTDNHRIQKFDSSGAFLTKWGSSGSGNGQFSNPRGVATDSSGNVYVVDTNNHRIQKFDSSGGYLSQWGSFGDGNGQFIAPVGVAMDSSGNIYVADVGNNRIVKYGTTSTPTAPPTSTATATPTATPPSYLTQWGSGGTGNGQLNLAYGVAVDSSGNVYIADKDNHRIQKFTSSGSYLSQWGSNGSGNGQFSQPFGVAVDSSGNVYVTDTYNNRIQKFSSSGSYLSQWGSSGSGNGQFNTPAGVAVDSSGNVYVADSNNHRIQKFTSSGSYLTQWGSSGSGDGQFRYSVDVAVDSSGNVYVVDGDNHRIQKFTSSGAYLTQWGNLGSDNGQLRYPYGVAVDSSGNVYVGDTRNYRIQKFSSSGSYLTQWGSEGNGNGQLNVTRGVAVDSSGNVYVVDSNNNRIMKYGTPTAQAPNLSIPSTTQTISNGQLSVPVKFAGNGTLIASVGFALDYQESCLTFDATDSDNNGVPDAISGLPAAFAPSISHQPSKSSGELEVALYDDSSPITPFSDGPLFTVQFTVKAACLPTAGAPTSVAINFASTPAATFGNSSGQDVAGTTTGATIPLHLANTAPTALSLDPSSVAENSPANTTVGAFSSSDANSGDSFTYTLVSGTGDTDNASFTIIGNTLKTTAVFDYESKSSYTIRVRTTDSGGLFFEQSLTITITDVSETPVAVDDVIDPRTTVFRGGQTNRLDVLANDMVNGGALQVASVTQPATGGGSVINNTTAISYTAPNASGATTFTYQATNGYATSTSANVSVSYVANHARGDCNGNGNVAAADFIAVVLEIFDSNDTKDNGAPAWWLTYTGDYPGSPLGCDANASGNGANNTSDSITAADITCSVLLFFGHACGANVQAAGTAQAAHLAVADQQAGVGASSTLTVTLNTGGNAIAAATFALGLDPAVLHFDTTDANEDGVPDAIKLHTPAGMSKSATWNAEAKRLEVAVFGMSLPLPTLTDGTLATVSIAVANDTTATTTPLALDLVSFSDPDGNDLPFTDQDGILTIIEHKAAPPQELFLPLIVR